MKKPILIMACLMASLASYAQKSGDNSVSSSEFKPSAKTLSTELNVNPFNGQVNLNNSLNQIKLRYFITPTLALRLGFNVSKIDSTVNTANPYGTSSYFYKNDKKSTTSSINFGIEKHFAGTPRLSPYIGADVSISNRSASQTIADNSSTTTIKDGWYDVVYLSNNTVVSQVLQPGYSRYGANLFSGFDFYIAKHFYFGYEVNFSLAKTNWKTVEVTVNNQSSNQPSTGTTNNSSLTFGPKLMNGIRIGYTF